jgi:hypothetical protein
MISGGFAFTAREISRENVLTDRRMRLRAPSRVGVAACPGLGIFRIETR